MKNTSTLNEKIVIQKYILEELDMRSGRVETIEKGDRLLDLREKYANLYLDAYELQLAFLPLFHENEEDTHVGDGTHRGEDNKGNHPQHNGGNSDDGYNGESGAHGGYRDNDNCDEIDSECDNYDNNENDDSDNHDDNVMSKR